VTTDKHCIPIYSFASTVQTVNSDGQLTNLISHSHLQVDLRVQHAPIHMTPKKRIKCVCVRACVRACARVCKICHSYSDLIRCQKAISVTYIDAVLQKVVVCSGCSQISLMNSETLKPSNACLLIRTEQKYAHMVLRLHVPWQARSNILWRQSSDEKFSNAHTAPILRSFLNYNSLALGNTTHEAVGYS
jgi:hypothetical protein